MPTVRFGGTPNDSPIIKQIEMMIGVAAPLANDLRKSDHLQLCISHVWPFNVAKFCQRNSRDNGP